VAKGNPVGVRSSGKSLDPGVERPLYKEEAGKKEKEKERKGHWD
jgi:hypothetical protein